MNTSMILLAAIALTLAGAPTLADDYSPGPGSGTPTAAPPAAPSADPTPPPMQPTVPGYRTYPNWAPGMAPPYAAPLSGYMRPRRPGYGYPGYRGRGWSPYPGHRQYGNPQGLPSNPPANQ